MTDDHMDAPTQDRGEEFARIAYQVLIVEKRWRLEDVAARIGWDYHVLYSRVRNRVPFTADEICRFVAAAPDARFAAYLLRGTRFVAAERPEGGGALDEGETAIHLATHRMIVEAADVVGAIEDALADRRIDRREAVLIRDEIETAERALATLGEHVKALAGR